MMLKITLMFIEAVISGTSLVQSVFTYDFEQAKKSSKQGREPIN